LFTKVERLISLRNLKPKKKEGFLKVISIFSFLGIMLGVAILIIVMSVMNGFRTDLTNKILGLNPHIIVQPNTSIIDNNFKLHLKKKYQNLDFYDSYNGEGIIISANNAKGILVKGINKSNLKSLFEKNDLIKGNFEKYKKGTTIIGAELSYTLGVKVGDKITIMSSAFMSTPLGDLPKQETFKIIGIFSSGFHEFDQNLIYINLSDVLSLFNITVDDTFLELYLKDPFKANAIKDEIKKFSEGYFIYSWSDLNKSFFSALKVERNVMFIILTLIIVVAAFNIISGLTILIKNKTKEIAILKTLGLSSLSIKKSFFLTGFSIGFSATVVGVILGVIFSFYIENIRNFLSQVFNLNIFPSDVYFLTKMPSEINFLSILIIFIFSILITCLASYFPARSISNMKTTDALKYE
jgi:lipoprotein-releasing system permease protein